MDMDHVIRVATRAAYKAGAVLREFQGNLTEIKKKGDIDLVTEADTASEKLIIDTIQAEFPDHGILAEESGAIPTDSPWQWIIDPLDGTTNYAHGLSLFSVSIALAKDGQMILGLVLNPATGELFSAAKGLGATLNGEPIQVSKTKILHESLLVTGFPYNFKEIINDLLARFSRCLSHSQGVRRLGSAAIDLCYVACGRFEGFWEQNLHPWDTAAGLLIVEEAGGKVTDFSNQPFCVDMKEIMATNGHIHQEMLPLLTV
jgi:myo-inositol-1(or 4)-monophosphatase